MEWKAEVKPLILPVSLENSRKLLIWQGESPAIFMLAGAAPRGMARTVPETAKPKPKNSETQLF
jgi:hypothetical protein